jgi:hypothetical protein
MAETQYKEVYIENKLDYGKFILDPATKEIYPQITKDFALSHLDTLSLKINEMRMEIANILVLTPEFFLMSLNSFLRDVNSSLQLNRSKHGFQAKLERSNLTGETTDTKLFERDKNKTIFSSKNEGDRR